jgi:hypothetical protein
MNHGASRTIALFGIPALNVIIKDDDDGRLPR